MLEFLRIGSLGLFFIVISDLIHLHGLKCICDDFCIFVSSPERSFLFQACVPFSPWHLLYLTNLTWLKRIFFFPQIPPLTSHASKSTNVYPKTRVLTSHFLSSATSNPTPRLVSFTPTPTPMYWKSIYISHFHPHPGVHPITLSDPKAPSS